MRKQAVAAYREPMRICDSYGWATKVQLPAGMIFPSTVSLKILRMHGFVVYTPPAYEPKASRRYPVFIVLLPVRAKLVTVAEIDRKRVNRKPFMCAFRQQTVSVPSTRM